MPVDQLNKTIGVLARRETEARLMAPLIDALSKAFGREEVLAVIRDTVIKIAHDQGAALAKEYGTSSDAFLETLSFWRQDGALEIDILSHSEEQLDFNVTRCRYAEMYKALGMEEYGAVLSCNRDLALIEGFDEGVKLDRDQTIMGGASCCTFRYDFSNADKS
jgi:uncharacterized protein YciU (UPF0263 family)